MEGISQRNTVISLRVLYPMWAIVGMFGLLYVPSRVIVAGDAIATAHNIASNDMLFRASIVSNLLTQLFFILVALFLYALFTQVNKRQSLLMVILALVSVPIAMISELAKFAAMLMHNNPDQVQLYLELHAAGITIASIFWGLWLFPLGYLIYASGFFPKLIGIFVLIAGFGYTVGSFLQLLAPNLEVVFSILEGMTFGEVLFILWFVVRGIRQRRVIG